MDADQLHKPMVQMVQNCIIRRVPVCRIPRNGFLSIPMLFV